MAFAGAKRLTATCRGNRKEPITIEIVKAVVDGYEAPNLMIFGNFHTWLCRVSENRGIIRYPNKEHYQTRKQC